MTLRGTAASLAATIGMAIAAAPAHATDYFATTDQTATAKDCLTEATACALGTALTTVPNGFVGDGSPFGKHTLTLLPGRYDAVDLVAGNPGAFNFRVPGGAIVQGKPGGERPVIAIGDPGGTDPSVRVTTGGVLRDVVVESTAFIGVSARGVASDLTGGRGELPAIIERVRIIAEPSPGDDESYGLSLEEVSRAANVDVEHRAATGSAVGIGYDAPTRPAPRLVGVTATSATAPALSISGGRLGTSATLEIPVVNSILRGSVDLDAKSDAFVNSPPPGFTPNPIRVSFTNTAVRTSSRTLAGPVTIAETGTIDTPDLKLAADRVPLAGSPLVDAGVPHADLGTLDVRSLTRTVGAAPDVGAYELATAPPPVENPTGGNPVPITAPAAPVDKTGPVATLTTPKTIKRSKLTKGKGVAFVVKLDEPAPTAKLELLQITKAKGKKPAKEKVLATATRTGTGTTITFTLKSKTSKVGTKGKLKLTLRFTFIDASGNKTVVEKPVTVS